MSKIMRFAIITLLVVIASEIKGQTVTFLGSNKIPLNGVNITLRNKVDTLKVLNLRSDSLGVAQLNLLANSQYLLVATHVGYEALYTVVSNQTQPLIFFMKESNSELQEVVVTSKKAVLYQEEDKTIFDAEQFAAASMNGYEVLKKTPSILVSNDGNVYLSSTTPATIYINGREQKMSSSDIASMLKNLPSKAIQKIEIMRIPSAKYDASNAGGAVNIILKKGVKIGVSGSFDIGYNQGRYNDQSIGGMLSNNNNSTTSYLSVNHIKSNNYEEGSNTRELSKSLFLSQHTYEKIQGKNTYIGYGIGTELRKNFYLDFDGSLSSGSSISSITNNNKQYYLDKTYIQNIDNNAINTQKLAFNQSLATRYKIDTLGSELTTDFSYSFFNKNNTQESASIYEIPSSFILQYKSDFTPKQSVLSGKVDLKYKYPNKSTLEIGAKYSYQYFENKVNYTNDSNVNGIISLENNSYLYKEKVLAGYIMYARYAGKFGIKGGFRVESTNMEGNQIIPNDTIFSIMRKDLFPYFHFSYPVLKIKGLEFKAFLIARRSITRPGYDNLNPFLQPVSQFLYKTGNPSLKPQFTQTYEANITVANYPILAFGRHYTTNMFSSVVYQDAKNPEITYQTYDNLGKNQETYFRLILGIPPAGKYFFFLGGQYSFNKYQGLYENKPLSYQRGSWLLFNYHQFNLDEKTTLTLYGHIIINGQQQLVEFSNIADVHFDINRYFFNKKLQTSFYVNDIFYTNPYSFILKQGSINAFGDKYTDSRRVGFSIKYSFGLKKKEGIINNGGLNNSLFNMGNIK